MDAKERFMEWLRGAPDEIDHPRFAEAGRVHDWRNYIPEELQAVWGELSLETRLVAAMLADKRAETEEWD